MPPRLFRPLLVAGAALAVAAPAYAQDAPPPAMDAAPATAAAHHSHPGYYTAAYERARADWLSECRRRHGSGKSVGAAARGAIGSAADNREARDYCQSYLDHHASYGHGYAYAMQPMLVMVPVVMTPAAAPAKPRECVEETVTEEYEEVPAQRLIPPPPRRVPPPKRVPDKRLRLD